MTIRSRLAPKLRKAASKTLSALLAAALLASTLAAGTPFPGTAIAEVVGICPVCGDILEDGDWPDSNGNYDQYAYGCYNCGSHWDRYGNALFIGQNPSPASMQDAVDAYISGYNMNRVSGFSLYPGVTVGANYCPSFSGTDYIYRVDGVECITARIEMTGSRAGDNRLANAQFGLTSTPAGYTWHHMGDYRVSDGTCTMQLVDSDIHRSISHYGACAQYRKYTGTAYRS